jgi:L-fuculose-phosphate aldolase
MRTPPYAVAMSLVIDELEPRDSEGELLCPIIPVVSGGPGSDVLAHRVARALAGTGLVIARGHGSFAAGRNLEEAYVLTSLVEHSSRILWLLSHIRSG